MSVSYNKTALKHDNCLFVYSIIFLKNLYLTNYYNKIIGASLLFENSLQYSKNH